MCGIAGIVSRDPGTPVDPALIRSMTAAMTHRGPDADGYFVDDGIGLGHRRLKIIDLELGSQPMFTEDRRLVTVFNGEIYNYRDLRTDLEAKGHRFRTRSDTETILYAFREHGERCVELFRGMFAMAIYDRTRRELTVIRDRIGIKPLYYVSDASGLMFASEVKPLLVALGERASVNTSMLDFYISVGYVPGEDTLFKNIRKLLPGHLLAYRDGHLSVRQYWDLNTSDSIDCSFDAAKEQLSALIAESVRLHLVSDVPLGAFLSGGLDSSTIVAFMSAGMSEPVRTFSVGYADQPESNELDYARVVAKHFQTQHHEHILKPLGFFDSLDLLLDFTEEPIVESAAVALYQLALVAKEHVTVVLSGEGGDEILAGYPLHHIMPKVDRIHRVLRILPTRLRRFLGYALRHHEKATKYWDWVSTPLATRYFSISNDVTIGVKRRMYAGETLLSSHETTSRYYQELFENATGTDLRRMSYADIKSWLPDDLLVKADKMTMAASLELRVPFLDHKVMEFATSLPDRYRLNGNQGKHILKSLMHGVLPPEIIYRKKQGFPVPIASWFRGPLYRQVGDVLLDERSRKRGYFRTGYVARVLQRHHSGKEDLSRRIFSLLALELWHRKYID